MLRNPDQVWQTLDTSIRQAREERSEMVKNWEKYYKAYRGVRKEKTFPWKDCANVNVPITAIVIDTIVASLCNSLFSLDPLYNVESYPDQGTEIAEAARKLKNFLRYAANEEIEDWLVTLNEWAFSAVLKGTGILKVMWRQERRRVGSWQRGFEVDGETGMTIPTEEEVWEDKIVYDAPWISVVDLENFVAPYGSKNINHAPFVAERIWIPNVVLKQRERDGWYENVDLATGDIREEGNIEAIQNRQQGQSINEQLHEGIYVWDYWGFADVDGDGIEEEAHIVIAENSPVILRAEPNPYFHGQKPYLRIPFLQEPNRFWGTGICESLYPLQEELNTIHNQRLDNVSLAINKVFTWIPDGTLMDDEDVEIYPGARIKLNDHGSLRMLEMGDIKYSSVNEEAVLIDYIQRLTGVTDMNLGQIPAAGRRAAATSLLAIMGEGNKKQELRVKTFRKPLEQLADMLKMLYYQYMPEGRRYQVPGSKVLEVITRDDFRYDVKFKISSTTLAESPELQQQKMQAWYALLSNNPLIASSPEAMFNLTREILRHSPISNIDEILPESVLEDMKRQQQMAGMQAGPGAQAGQDMVRELIGGATGAQGADMGGMSPGQHMVARPGVPDTSPGVEIDM